MKRLLAILLVFPFLALAHDKPKPEPKPAPKPVVVEHNHNEGWVVAAAVAAGLVGVVIYNQKTEKEEKKVSLQPTSDGHGASANLEWRF